MWVCNHVPQTPKQVNIDPSISSQVITWLVDFRPFRARQAEWIHQSQFLLAMQLFLLLHIPSTAPSCQSEGLMLKRVPVLKVGVISSFRYSGLRGTGQDLGPNDIPNGRPTALTCLNWSHRTTWNYPAGLTLKKTGRDPTSFRFWPTIHWPRMIDMMHDLWFTEDGTMSSCSLGWSSW